MVKATDLKKQKKDDKTATKKEQKAPREKKERQPPRPIVGETVRRSAIDKFGRVITQLRDGVLALGNLKGQDAISKDDAKEFAEYLREWEVSIKAAVEATAKKGGSGKVGGNQVQKAILRIDEQLEKLAKRFPTGSPRYEIEREGLTTKRERWVKYAQKSGIDLGNVALTIEE